MVAGIENILDSFLPVRLEEMDSVRLMDRIDTKYIFSVNRICDLLKSMNGKYRLLDINGHRISDYTSTYLDTPDYQFFDQHVTGRPYRNKVRFRQYNSTGISFLEIKHKTHKNRTVKRRIENSLTEYKFDKTAIEFINKHIPGDAVLLNPVMINNFKRITFTGLLVPERITLDMDLSFTSPDGRSKEIPAVAIAELKSDGPANRSPFSVIIKEACIYPSGFSKYCIGCAYLYDLPRRNNLKPKFLHINRIENEYYESVSA